MKRIAQIIFLGILVAFTAGAGDVTGRYDKLSHQLMCPCGCNQLLGECNHVGCPDSDKMRGKLMSAVGRGDDTKAIFIDFQNEYGPPVLSAPRFTAFNHLAWVLPPLIVALGVGLIAFTVRRWKLHTATMPASPKGFSQSELDGVRERIRRETEI